MEEKTRSLLKNTGIAAGLLGAALGLVMAVKRVTCPCCGTPLPFLGGTKPFGPRYCTTCRHNH